MVMRARRAGRVDAALLLSSLCATAIASEAPHNPYAPPRPAQGGAAGGYAAGGYAAGGYAGGYDENLWDVPPPPDAVAVLRPFRIATRGSAAFTFGLAAFRATSLADRARLLQLGPLGALAKPSFGLNAAAAALVAADRAPKVAAKALLYGNVVLEAMAGAGSLARAAFPTSGQLLPADAHLVNCFVSFWLGLIALACARSRWIQLPPAPKAGRGPPAYGGHLGAGGAGATVHGGGAHQPATGYGGQMYGSRDGEGAS